MPKNKIIVMSDEAFELFVASREGDLAGVDAILERGTCDIDCTDKVRLTPLSLAVQKRQATIVQRLLAAKANTEIKDTTGEWTPLHYAAAEGFADITALLLDAEADVNVRDNVRDTPLNEALRHGHQEVAKLLLAAKASVLARSNARIDAVALARTLDAERRKVGSDAAALLLAIEEAAVEEAAAATAAAAVAAATAPSSLDGSDQPVLEDEEEEERASGPALIPVGSAVIVQGLVSKPELNGARGQIIGLDQMTGRYQVRLEGAEDGIKLRRECVREDQGSE